MVTVVAVTMTATIVYDTSEARELCASRCLYLKPIAKLTMTVMLPELKEPTKTISNWEVMEKLKDMVYPDLFINLKVTKSTTDFIRFEGEVETKGLLKTVMAKLQGRTIDINGGLRVLAAEAQYEYPTPQDWESFFKSKEGKCEDLSNLLPDTLHVEGLPCKWFTSKESNGEKPCEEVVKTVFGIFGTIRNIDIPMLDPYREDMTGKSFSTFSLGGFQTFDAYIQYQENSDFIKAMETLRGMKLLYKGDDGKALACNIKVTFDTTDHLSEASIQKRYLERLKLQELEQQRKEEKRREKEEEEEAERKRKDNEEKARKRKRLKKQRQKERQEKRCLRKLQQLKTAEEPWLQGSDEWEKRKFLLAQRRVESIRLLTVLLNKVKDLVEKKDQKEADQECKPDIEAKDDKRDIEAKDDKLDIEEKKDDKLDIEAKHDKLDSEAKKDTCQDAEAGDMKEQMAQIKETMATDIMENNTKAECHKVKIETGHTSGVKCEVPEKEKNSALLHPVSKTLSTEKRKEQGNDNLLTVRNKNKHYLDCGALQVTINQNCSKSKLCDREKSCTLDMRQLRMVTDLNSRKRQKIYETDEFINYLLNYYESPRYARVCESQQNPGDKAVWHRVVSENGDGFRIQLKSSSFQQFTEVNIVHDLEEKVHYNENQHKWKITITETEPKEKISKLSSRKQPGAFSEELQLQLNNSTTGNNLKKHKKLSKTVSKEVCTSAVKKIKLSDLQPRSHPGKSNNTVLRLNKPVSKARGAVHELRDVLEEISSDSEYFSEESSHDHSKIRKVGKGAVGYVAHLKPIKHDLGSLVKAIKGKKKLVSAKRLSSGNAIPLSQLALQSDTEKKGSKKVIRKKTKAKSKRPKNEPRCEEQESDPDCIQEWKALNKKKKKKRLLQKKVLIEESESSETDSSSAFEPYRGHLKKGSSQLKQNMSVKKIQCSPTEYSPCDDEYPFENANRYANRQRKTKHEQDEVTNRHSFHAKMFDQSYEYNDESYYCKEYMHDYNIRKETVLHKEKSFDTRHGQSRHLNKRDASAKKRIKAEK